MDETRADKLGDLRIVLDEPPIGWTVRMVVDS